MITDNDRHEYCPTCWVEAGLYSTPISLQADMCTVPLLSYNLSLNLSLICLWLDTSVQMCSNTRLQTYFIDYPLEEYCQTDVQMCLIPRLQCTRQGIGLGNEI